MKAQREAMEALEAPDDNNYQEIRKLHERLKQAGIKHHFHRIFSGYQVLICIDEKRVASVVEHEFSYGSNQDLLELMAGSEPIGWLTTEECMEQLKNILEKRQQKLMFQTANDIKA